MKPYQVDRVLMHLKQAGKFEGVHGIVLGEFPDSEPAVAGVPTVREVCARILRPLGVPIVFGAPVGHTVRPLLTIPLGIKARLDADGEGTLEFLESAGGACGKRNTGTWSGFAGPAVRPRPEDSSHAS